MEHDKQSESLRKLVGKFSGTMIRKPSLNHLKRVRKILNAMRNLKVEVAQIRSHRSYLLNQISQRDLMLDDCYETLKEAESAMTELEKRIESLESENSKLRSRRSLGVVA